LLNISRTSVALAFLIFVFMILPQTFSQTFMTVTVSTDKAQYVPGETVTISGKVLDNQSNPVVGAAVSIEVNEPPIYVQLVSSDQSGSFTNQFVLSNSFPQGQYTIYVTAHKGNFTAAQQTQFSVIQETSSTSSATSAISQVSTSQATPPSQCFIATATYGSEAAPEVKLLRNLRDTEILQTFAGRSFMMAFNAFYYSFSPTVASYIASNAASKSSMRIVLYPLIGILDVSGRIFVALSYNREAAVTTAGIFAGTSIGIIYLTPVVVAVRKLTRSRKIEARVILLPTASCLSAVSGLAAGEILRAYMLVTVASVVTVLSCVLLGGLSTAYLVQWAEVEMHGPA